MKKFFARFFRILLRILLGFLIVTVSWVVLYRFVNPPFTYLMVLRYFQSEKKDKSIEKDWKSYSYISPRLPLAVIASEDQNFFNHFGFDINAIEKALKDNKSRKKKTVKGASTISQQTAKNVFLFPSRNWVRKGLEVYFTFLIESFWSKERILEVYLNIIELGDGVYGAEAASKKYFRKTAMNLTGNEAALLAAVLPNPLKMSAAKPSGYVVRRQVWIMNQMENLGGENFLKQEVGDEGKK